MKKPQHRTHRTADQMFPLMERYNSSGQSIKEFCVQHGLNEGTFHYWLKKYRAQKSIQTKDSFRQIKVVADKSVYDQGNRRIEIRTPSGLKINIPLD